VGDGRRLYVELKTGSPCVASTALDRNESRRAQPAGGAGQRSGWNWKDVRA
jgi:hypothetical protein